MQPNTIILSHATYVGASGATAAATYAFFSSDYKPPTQERYIENDVVKNQNGKFKYIYDNGPGWRKWSPFSIRCEDAFQNAGIEGAAATQYNNLRRLWDHPGVLGMQTPDGSYVVHWSNSLEQNFRVFPKLVNDKIEYEVVVQFEEGQ